MIEGTGDRTNYSFAVDGNLSGKGLTSEDDINGSYAHGAVAPGQDVYRFDGSLHAFTFSGASVAVKLDGDWAHVGQRPDYVLTITGTGSYASYAFDVSRNLQPHDGITSEDDISGTHAEGAVRNGTDAYLFNGDLEAFSFEGEIAVKQNGQWAHVGQLPESTSGSDDNNNGTSDLRLGYNARKRSHDKGRLSRISTTSPPDGNRVRAVSSRIRPTSPIRQTTRAARRSFRTATTTASRW